MSNDDSSKVSPEEEQRDGYSDNETEHSVLDSAEEEALEAASTTDLGDEKELDEVAQASGLDTEGTGMMAAAAVSVAREKASISLLPWVLGAASVFVVSGIWYLSASAISGLQYATLQNELLRALSIGNTNVAAKEILSIRNIEPEYPQVVTRVSSVFDSLKNEDIDQAVTQISLLKAPPEIETYTLKQSISAVDRATNDLYDAETALAEFDRQVVSERQVYALLLEDMHVLLGIADRPAWDGHMTTMDKGEAALKLPLYTSGLLRGTPVIDGIPDGLSTSSAVISAIEARYGARQRLNTGSKRIRLDDVRVSAAKLASSMGKLAEEYNSLQQNLVDAERTYEKELRAARDAASRVLAQAVTPSLSQHTVVSYELMRDKLRRLKLELPELFA